MDQNQPVDNDLQKAIDDITNITNIDPVFSDPVAAPSSIPEGDTGELSEPIGPFPAPEPKVEAIMPAPEPIAPLQSMDIPEFTMPNLGPIDSTPTMPPAPEPAPEPTPEPTHSHPTPKHNPTPNTLNMHQVKEAALRDLMPLIDHLNMSPTQKFALFRNIFENLRDYTVLNSAYKAASAIPNDTERAEALLYLIESIDKM